MKLADATNSLTRVPHLTLLRMALAMVVAVAADGLQLLLGPFGWEGLNQAVDLAAMLLLSWILGFHLLFLPTFVIELVPLADDFPTWTACTVAVLIIKKREQRNHPLPASQPKPTPSKPGQKIIDV